MEATQPIGESLGKLKDAIEPAKPIGEAPEKLKDMVEPAKPIGEAPGKLKDMVEPTKPTGEAPDQKLKDTAEPTKPSGEAPEKLKDMVEPTKPIGEAPEKLKDTVEPTNPIGEAPDQKLKDTVEPTKPIEEELEKVKDATEQTKPIREALETLEKVDEFYLTGAPGVGKTRIARILSDYAIKKLKYDYVLWVFMNNKNLDERTIHETISCQLSLSPATSDYEVEPEEDVSKTGDPGVGKTGMAKKMSDYAIIKLEYDLVLEKFKNKEDIDEKAIHEPITRQLSITPPMTESDIKEDTKSKAEETKKLLEEIKDMYLVQDIIDKLADKKVLLIVDDQVHPHDSGKNGRFDELMKNVEPLLRKIKQKKILITTRAKSDPSVTVEPLTNTELLVVLKREMKDEPDDEIKSFIKESKPCATEIIFVSKAWKHLKESEPLEVAKEKFSSIGKEPLKAMKFLLKGYEPLPNRVLLDWYSPRNQFLKHGKSLHYKELIVYWILEGYLGHSCITNAYAKGHSIIMELLQCGMLKEQNNGYVMVNHEKLAIDSAELCEFIQTIHLGLGNVLDGESERIVESNGAIEILCIGKEKKKKSSALLVDSYHLDREIPEVWPESMEGLEILATFNPTNESFTLPLEKMPNCRILVLRGCDFLKTVDVPKKPDHDASGDDKPELSLSDKKDMIFSVSDENTKIPASVEAYNPGSSLGKLIVLEISGPNSLKEIPDELFRNTPNLQSLNLSHLQISLLPGSFYNLIKLVWLILRGCSRLEELKSLKDIPNLQVLDLSGAKSFTRFHDRTFEKNKELRMLNLSQTKIKKLPLVRDLKNLEHLLLRDCTEITRLPRIRAVTSLEILDLSGAENFKEFHDPSLEDLKKLKVIDISGTAVKKLPLHMSNPRNLSLRGCPRLTRFSFIESMKGLEELDLSECTVLQEINERYFKELGSLRVLNVSGTKVKTLPSLSNLHNLRKLLLARCDTLKELGDLGSLGKLEELDLSGSIAFEKLESSKELMDLKKLDLSETKITSLPPLSNFINLVELLLKNCTKLEVLEEVPSPGALKKLEKLNLCGSLELREIQDGFFKGMTNLHTLDLSETKIKKLPSLLDSTNLTHLLLRNCRDLSDVPDLKDLTKIQVLDLSGTDVEKLPEFEESSELQHLLLKDCLKLEGFSQVLKKPDEEIPYKISNIHGFKVLELPKTIVSTVDVEDKWTISWPAQQTGADFIISVDCAQFLEHLKVKQTQEIISDLRYYIHPDKFSKDEFLLRKDYIQTWENEKRRSSQASEVEKKGFLDIRGFVDYPKEILKEIGLVVTHAKYVFLIFNPVLRWLTDLGAENIKKTELCWIENCENMETVLPVEKVKIDAENVEDIASLHGGNLYSHDLDNLKFLYLENCSKLTYICHSSQQLANLVVLQIKHCGKLATLFEDESANLPKLQKLQLWKLPCLQKIVCKMPSLSSLIVGECPQLQHILPSAHVAVNFKVLEIRSCENLETIFVGSKLNLDNLSRSVLLDLPKLRNIGDDIPEKKHTLRGCPLLNRAVELGMLLRKGGK